MMARLRAHPVFAWPAAALVGAAFGILEGALYRDVRIDQYAYWALLGALIFALLASWVGLARGVLLFPLAVVVQDAFSLVLQGGHPFTATWYLAFAPAWFGGRAYLLPNFYWYGIGVAVVGEAALLLARRLGRARGVAAPRPVGGR